MTKKQYNVKNYWRDQDLVLLPNLSFINKNGSLVESKIDSFKIVSLSEWVVGLSNSGYRDIPDDVVSVLCKKFRKLPEKPKETSLLCCIIKKNDLIAFVPWGNMVCIWDKGQCKWITRRKAEDIFTDWKLNFSLVQKYLSEVKDKPEFFMPSKKPGLINKVK